MPNDTPSGPAPSAPEGEAPPFPPPAPAEPLSSAPAWLPYTYTPRVRFQHRWWLHILLLLLTIASTTLAAGPWYSATIIGILGAHEMGHYLACRYYRVDATLPFFIPLLLPFAGLQTGTLGAVIRIREPFPTRAVLFDIGIAGPIAGFVVLVPLLFLGMSWSEVIPVFPTDYQIGRPLLYQFARWVTFGHIPETHFVSLHPMVIGAWFGMLATALNLLPFGQLDGGHITYSVMRRAATPISLVTVASAVVMSYFSLSWVVMTTLMIAMLFLVGTRHPPVLNDREPLGRGRYWLAVFALVMLILCFTPAPIRITLP